MAVYKPKVKIAIASSFEGIVNDGAPECALTSFNAYHNMEPRAFFGRRLTSREFSSEYRGHPWVRAFLAVRPMVEVAEDYGTVLDVMLHPAGRIYAERLAENPHDTRAYLGFEELFNKLKERTDWRTAFGTGKQSHFYKERTALKQADLDGWRKTQEPFDDVLPQFRALIDTQTRIPDAPHAYAAVSAGFAPWFATSKDEASTFDLCMFYAKILRLDPSDIGEDGTQVCMITRDRIIGLEHTRDKAEQMKIISKEEGIHMGQVWRLNDRYDPKQQEKLYEEGVVYQFLLPGYAAQHEIEKSRKDKFVRLLDRRHFAEQLAAYAEQWFF